MRIRRRLPRVILFPLIAILAPGADAAARIDAFVASEMARAKIPGIAVGVVRDGRTVVARGYGLADVEHRVPVKTATAFQSGSIGKQFLATAVMLLAEDGALSVDDPVEKHLGPVPDGWKPMTIHHLLSHTSGLQDYPESFDLRRDYTEDEMLAMAKSSPMAFAPGTGWTYSNLGYVTLGILVRKVSGKFYGDVLAERVFGPLGMTASRVISEADIVPDRASGYRLRNGELKNQEWVAPMVNTTADGSLYLTLDDMLRWERALAAGRPLRPGGLERMWTPAPIAGGREALYGYGWFTLRSGGRRVIFHGGAWQGFKAFIARFPDDRLTVILLANLAEANEWRLARGVAAVFLPELALDREPPALETEPAVIALAKKVLRQIAVSAPDAGLFAPDALPTPERVRELRAQLESVTLPPALIASLEFRGRRDEGGRRVYRYALTDLLATEYFTLALAADGRIAGIDLTR